ncbi:MAG: hypothetical protein WBL21_00275 [Salinimicrobium sp.]
MEKKLFAVIIVLLSLYACGDDTRDETVKSEKVETVTDSLTTITGDFIYLADAAVLKGKDFIYGVELDSVSRKLVDSVAPLKRDNFDMIPVTVRAKIVKNLGEGWEEIVQIREILEVSQPEADTVNGAALYNNEEQD